jgi:hypothetical protein
MEKVYKYTVSMLNDYLGQVCETDRQKRKYKVIQDLQLYCKLSESEAVTIWNEATERNILTLYNTWEQDDLFKTYSYDGKYTGEAIMDNNDFVNKGMSNTYHNTKTEQSLKHGRYGQGRIDNRKRATK